MSDLEVAVANDPACIGATGVPPACNGDSGTSFCRRPRHGGGEVVEASPYQVGGYWLAGGALDGVFPVLTLTAADLHPAISRGPLVTGGEIF